MALIDYKPYIDRCINENIDIKDNKQLARLLGFNTKEIEFMDMFWDPCFSKGWILMNRETLVKWFGYSSGRNIFCNFKNKVLMNPENEFKENIHFKYVFLEEDIKKDDKTEKNTNLCEITGETFQLILLGLTTTVGRQTKKYFLKIEKGFLIFREILAYFQRTEMERQLNESRQLIEFEKSESKRLLFEKDQKINSMNKLVNDIKYRKKFGGYIYVVGSKNYGRENLFKVGRTDGCLKKRLSTYNTSKSDNDKMFYVLLYKCHNTKELEYKINYMLDMFRDKKQSRKEYFCIHFTLLKSFLDKICNNYNEEINHYNTVLDNLEYWKSLAPVELVPLEIPVETSEDMQDGYMITEFKDGEVKTETKLNLNDIKIEQVREILIKTVENTVKTIYNLQEWKVGDPPEYKTVDADGKETTHRINIVWKVIKENLTETYAKSKSYKSTRFSNELDVIARANQYKIKWTGN